MTRECTGVRPCTSAARGGPDEQGRRFVLHSKRWPRWRKGLEGVREIASGEGDGVGNVRRYRWGSPFGYRLCIELRDMRGAASLEGARPAARRDARLAPPSD